MAGVRFGKGEMLSGTALASPNGSTSFYLQHILLTDELDAALGTLTNPIYVAASGGGEAVTIADGADVAEGAKAASAYSDATGVADGTVVGLGKGNYVITAAMSAKLPASLGSKTGAASFSVVPASDGFSVVAGGNVAINAVDSGNPVKIGGIAESGPPTYTTGNRANASFGTRGALRVTLFGDNSGTPPAVGSPSDGASASSALYVNSQNKNYNGSQWDSQRGDTNGAVSQPYAMTSSRFTYAAATGGIVNTTTAVTFIAAAGASVRNYVTAVQIDWDALGVATEVAIRDGAAGTVLWRMKIPAGVAGMREVQFPVALKGTANTLMEVVTLTASVTGGVFFNAGGFQGT